MSRVDERLAREFRKAQRPVRVDGLLAEVDRRLARRAKTRKLGVAALTVIVVGGTLGGFILLSDVFSENRDRIGLGEPMPIEPKENGRIVASRQRGSGPLELVSLMPDGTGSIVIPTPPGDPWLPAWSPDGTRIAVAIFPNGGGPRAIWTMDADGDRAAKIAEASNVSRPSWSPDGERIAYAADTPAGSEIHVVDADGRNDRVIGDTIQDLDHFSASFSPDGTQIVYDVGTDSGFDIFLMDADGSDVRQLTFSGTDYNPSWSPDGHDIAFTRQEEGSESDIYVMRVDGSNVRRLTNGEPGETNLYPEWSPDGTKIAYNAGVTGGPGALVVMNADGSEPTTVLPDGVLGLAWQPLPDGAAERTGPAPAGRDIGLGFRLCNLAWLGGIDLLGDGTSGSAWTATRVNPDGTCPSAFDGRNGIAVDFTGDRVADGWSETIEHCTGCHPFLGGDLDGDGTEEVIVVLQDASITQYGLYIVRAREVGGEPQVLPYLVGEPGHAEAGYPAGEPFTFWAGGDEGSGEYVHCDALPTFRLTSIYFPVDGGEGDVTTVHETEVALGTDGIAHIRAATRFTVPYPDVVDLQYATSRPACGIDFHPGP
jgi:TolB protein